MSINTLHFCRPDLSKLQSCRPVSRSEAREVRKIRETIRAFRVFRGHDKVGIDVVTAELANRVIRAVVCIAFAFTGFHVSSRSLVVWLAILCRPRVDMCPVRPKYC